MRTPQPTAADREALGLLPSDFPDDHDAIWVWPDNWLAATVFEWLGSQWSVGPGGPVGLRYEAFPEARLRFGVDLAAWPDLCDALQVMEGEALRVMRQEQ